jgi:hypothetical protein
VWNTIWRVVRPENGPSRGRRHLIVFHPGDLTSVAGYGLISAVAASRATLQVIAMKPCPSLEEFCAKTQGSFYLAGTDEAVERQMAQAYLNLLARYDIAYHPPAGEGSVVKVRVQSTHGWGEVTVSVR